ncbi:MAG: rod shape-determining protein MreC [Gammaproteobacteria bacterium]|nr:rod shape-determining protein MreC [Gammaproteobacteria bacterium]
MKLLFTQGPSITARLVVFVLASVVLMTVDHRQQTLDTVRTGLSVLMYPLQFLIDLPSTAGGWLQESVSTRRNLQEENARLRAQYLLQQARLQKLDALEAENRRLRELLDSSFKAGDRVLIAELMSVDFDPYRHQVLLNKGERDGVFVGQPLLDAYGVMGQIAQVTPFTATAILITDPAHAIPVQVNRNGVRGILVGTGSLAEVSLPNITNSADIRVGDLLVTSGLGGRFPPGYPVAQVTSVSGDSGHAFAEIGARPLSHLDRSREVLLVWPPTPSEPPAPVTTDEPLPEPEPGAASAPASAPASTPATTPPPAAAPETSPPTAPAAPITAPPAIPEDEE